MISRIYRPLKECFRDIICRLSHCLGRKEDLEYTIWQPFGGRNYKFVGGIPLPKRCLEKNTALTLSLNPKFSPIFEKKQYVFHILNKN